MSSRARSVFAVVTTLAALAGGGAWQARAEPGGVGTAATPTTINPLVSLLPGLFPTTTVAPPPKAPAPAPKAPQPAPKDAPKPGSPTTTAVPPRVIPPGFQTIINSIPRGGTNNTGALLGALKRLEDFGLSPAEAAALGMGHFPVAGYATFRQDYLEPRFTPSFHLHQGTDIFAAYGTPVRAPFDGTLRFGNDPPGGGLGAYVTTADGTYYYMAHLSAFARQGGGRVKQGEIIGYVGDSGNAQGGSPHVHFQVHPRGGGPVDPYPILVQWLKAATDDVSSLVARYAGRQPQILTATGLIRRFDGARGPFSAPSRPPVGSLLWASSVAPAGSALRLAEMQVARAAGEIDWDGRASSEQEQAEAWREADDAARSLLAPVTPPALNRILGPSG